MLSFSLVPNHSGIRLGGDYTSLKALYHVIGDINDRSPLIKDQEGLFIALAHDVRKAYQKQREIIQPPEHFEEIGTRYGVEIIWPVLLLQHQLLRSSLGFIDHGPGHQACAYMLETVIEDALKADFGADADHIRLAWKSMSGSASFFEERYSPRCARSSAPGVLTLVRLVLPNS
jgi:hypothetical protein